ncbi:unnamed protein product [Eruca vesicaria subsp. sativa]|uniref:Uncharacterized protein n=1 Tax=Eruca vesicaria subsp. sativa TaxID=29727 RepID=A0ABC8L5Y7_ERUVS|nr:unnamed protein product [Eruca vesicaria subsp. sativa]
MDARRINIHFVLLSLLIIAEVPSFLGLSMRVTTKSEPEAFHGEEYFPAMKKRKLMVTNMEVDYSGDYDDGASSASPSPPVPDYDDIYRRQGDVPSPGIGH